MKSRSQLVDQLVEIMYHEDDFGKGACESLIYAISSSDPSPKFLWVEGHRTSKVLNKVKELCKVVGIKFDEADVKVEGEAALTLDLTDHEMDVEFAPGWQDNKGRSMPVQFLNVLAREIRGYSVVHHQYQSVFRGYVGMNTEADHVEIFWRKDDDKIENFYSILPLSAVQRIVNERMEIGFPENVVIGMNRLDEATRRSAALR